MISSSFEFKSKVGISLQDLEFLKQELENAWNQAKVPIHHREIFTKYSEMLPLPNVPAWIAKEIVSIESGDTPIQLALSSIESRECLIGKLKDLQSRSKPNKAFDIPELEAAHLIKRLRKATSITISQILAWKKGFVGMQFDFYWQHICYLEKLKHDLDFLDILARFRFMRRDPFFLNMDCSAVCKKARILLRIPQKTLNKYLRLQKIISYGMEEVQNISLGEAKKIDKSLEHIFDAKVPSKKEIELVRKINWEMTFEIFEELIDRVLLAVVSSEVEEEAFVQNLEKIVRSLGEKCFDDLVVIEAYGVFHDFLRDHSKSVLETYIEEAISKLIYESINTKTLLTHNVACDVCDGINFIATIKSAFQEIREENALISSSLTQKFCEELLSNSWIDSLVNMQITYERLNTKYKEVPLQSLESIDPPAYTLLCTSIFEEIYQDYIDAFVGDLWLKSLIKYSQKEIRGADEPPIHKLLPIALRPS